MSSPSEKSESPEPQQAAEPEASKQTIVDQPTSDSSSPTPPEPDGSGATESASESAHSGSREQSAAASSAPPPPNDWQAIWSPQHGAYYFYNSRTNETTWINPLEPTPSGSTAEQPVPSTHSYYDAQSAAAAQGIDPALAHLDPSLAAGPSAPSAHMYTAKFNARTGAFAKPDARNPDHVSEYERAKRMSEFYFDVSQWEKDVEARKAEEEETGKKRKKPTKKDLEMFKERKKQKKIAKTAWLRT
ncbi:hypothetical protein BD410DRAFT_781811 [Rickenella mellea]|uniref:WW domain-containing protein n=1 Tax=Rickenella mellea TaxID=50990 RepID=A0A4Y7QKL5_9AGAM|nr:hypothetical protein BD410DRAFT_781811 [Rickenella mellea]